MKYITNFRDYDDLPFSKKINKELFKRHSHAEIEYEIDTDQIVYTEKDVLILLQIMQQEIKNYRFK